MTGDVNRREAGLGLTFLASILRKAAVAAVLSSAWVRGQGVAANIAIPNEQFRGFVGPNCALPDFPGCKAMVANDVFNVATRQWGRTEIELPEGLRGRSDLGVLVGVGEMYRLYVNGQQIGASGDFATQSGPVNGRAIFPLPAALTMSGRLVVAVESLAVPGPFTGIVGPPMRIGPLGGLDGARRLDTLEYLHRYWLHYLSFLLIFFAGCYFLLLFATQRKSREHLWLGLTLIGLGLLRLGELAMVVDLGVGVKAAGFNNLLWNVLFTPLYVEFSFALARRKIPRFFRVVQAVYFFSNAIDFALLLPMSLATFERCVSVFNAAGVPAVMLLPLVPLVFLVPLPECWRSRDPEMKWIGAALTFIALEEMGRYSGQIGLPTIPQDVLVRGVDIDLRGLSFAVFSVIMIVAMMVRYRRAQGRAQSMELEIEAARTVQQVLIPEELPQIAGLTIESVYRPAQQVGGDFFQVMAVEDGAALVVMGDVSGKGMQAAMTVSLLVGAVRTEAEHTSSPARLMQALNRRSYGRGSSFTTCLILHVARDGEVTAANAGHLQPYVGGREVELDSGLPLGFDLDAEYAETRFVLQPGERLTLVTDGVVEAANAKKELFGFARTAAVSANSAHAIADEAQLFGMPAAQGDDITVLTLVRGAPA